MGCTQSSGVSEFDDIEYEVYDSDGNLVMTWMGGSGSYHKCKPRLVHVVDEPDVMFEQVKPESNVQTNTTNDVYEGVNQLLQNVGGEPKRSYHSAVHHNTMYCENTLISNPLYTYKIGAEREEKIVKKTNMHGGLNQSLKNHGHIPEGNCSNAIKKAYENGLIDEETRNYCTQVNQKGNDASHNWGPKKGETKESDDEPKLLSNSIFTYRAGRDRMNRILSKANQHGGVNQQLRNKGLKPESNFKQAIEKAYKHDVIDKETKNNCQKTNSAGNEGNHEWGQK